MNTPPRLSHLLCRPRQRGSVAVELAGVFLVLLALLFPTFLVGQVLYQHNVLTNVANVAARYMAKGTPAELQNGTRAAGAREIVSSILADAGMSSSPDILIVCKPGGFCSGTVTAVELDVQVQGLGDGTMLPHSFYLRASATAPYPQ
jgi:Flp pilus assembly protein TadG